MFETTQKERWHVTQKWAWDSLSPSPKTKGRCSTSSNQINDFQTKKIHEIHMISISKSWKILTGRRLFWPWLLPMPGGIDAKNMSLRKIPSCLLLKKNDSPLPITLEVESALQTFFLKGNPFFVGWELEKFWKKLSSNLESWLVGGFNADSSFPGRDENKNV